MKIDLHMHSDVSDGTNSPETLLQLVRDGGYQVFSLTDHDACAGCQRIAAELLLEDPIFISGIEISAEQDGRKFHILGYQYDPDGEEMKKLISHVHGLRMNKLHERLTFLRERFGFVFTAEECDRLSHLNNPGKPHIGQLMVAHGYVDSITQGIEQYLNQHHSSYRDISPELAIQTILQSGGIPVLAHGLFGNGSQRLDRKELEYRIAALKEVGLMGVECYYSGYSQDQEHQTRALCEQYQLLATAGSDYHGAMKAVSLGEHGLTDAQTDRQVMEFLRQVGAFPSIDAHQH